jgi:hypothetical protein
MRRSLTVGLLLLNLALEACVGNEVFYQWGLESGLLLLSLALGLSRYRRRQSYTSRASADSAASYLLRPSTVQSEQSAYNT